MLVERLLDDISDIWVGASIVEDDGDGLYTICYEDNGSLESEVCDQELRPRQMRLDFPAEVWSAIGHCTYGKVDLCSFEVLVKGAHDASKINSSIWWCVAYHDRFGRCGPRCEFERLPGRLGAELLSKVARSCTELAAKGLTAIDRKSWKQRYVDHELWIETKGVFDNSPGSPGNAAYAISGRKVDYSGGPTAGMFFDPRLGKMVREG